MTSTDTLKMAKSDFNLQAITTEQYETILKAAIETRSNVTVFGRRGSGKTVIAKDVIKNGNFFDGDNRFDVREVYINLSTAERTDMGGYPDMFGLTFDKDESPEQKRSRFISFLLPLFFEPLICGNRPVVAVFDEVDKADSSLHAPLLEIFQFKKINGRPLPNLFTCVATGNLISEGSQRPSLPLLDRTEKYLLQPDIDSWLRWAGKSGKIHPSVASFLYDKPTHLFGSEDGAGDNYAEPSPRAWELYSNVVFKGERLQWSKELIMLKAAGFVGKEAGIQYDIYFTNYQELLPLVNRVFQGENIISEYKALDTSMQLYSAMIVCSRMGNILDNAKVEAPPKELAYVGKFLQHVDEENVLIAVRTQLNLSRLVKWKLDRNPEWAPTLAAVTESAHEK